jgi:transglutaminase-like putative cysteine protease
MFYAIRHFTRYRYSRAVSQSVMEVRMHPRSEQRQRCFTFQLSVSPRARIFSYSGHMGNLVHHFDIPAPHRQLTIIADALVDVDQPDSIPDALDPGAWDDLDRMIEEDDYWDMLRPSGFARPSPALDDLRAELGLNGHVRDRDPLTLLTQLNTDLFTKFQYVKASTQVDSPIEVALQNRSGVCQDFAHIMTALVRSFRIPCRYVSGYLYHDAAHHDRSRDGATHAWVEALLPELGWVGFDPTNNLIAGGRHIRTAIGRDYTDVPPALGTMKGSAETELHVRVRVSPSEAILPPDQEFASDQEWSKFLEEDQAELVSFQQQQQQ